MALASPHVHSSSIEAQEYPQLAASYAVSSVPKIVINDRVAFLGGLPEDAFVDAVLSAAGIEPGPTGSEAPGGSTPAGKEPAAGSGSA
jgi:predicted DsbA family dithiol-disulfide isomerase